MPKGAPVILVGQPEHITLGHLEEECREGDTHSVIRPVALQWALSKDDAFLSVMKFDPALLLVPPTKAFRRVTPAEHPQLHWPALELVFLSPEQLLAKTTPPGAEGEWDEKRLFVLLDKDGYEQDMPYSRMPVDVVRVSSSAGSVYGNELRSYRSVVYPGR